jgi:NADP-dependent 3-hydroxy acid dehydrogenase YdfG
MIGEQIREEAGQSSPLKGKRCLVSGGTTGIGRAIAEALAAEGARVMVFGRHDAELQEALASINQKGEGYGLTADQSRLEDVQRVFAQVDQDLGGLDILVNNAAIATSSVTDTAPEDYVYTIQSNLAGYMHCCNMAIPRMKEQGGGRIINMGSMSAKLMEAGSDIYVSTKAAIRGFSDSLCKSQADDKITVTLVEPGLVDTDLSERSEEETQEKYRKMEILPPEDIARCVVFCLTQPKRVCIPVVQIRPLMQKV